MTEPSEPDASSTSSQEPSCTLAGWTQEVLPGLIAHPFLIVGLACLAWVAWLVRLELVVLFAAVLFGVALYRAGQWVASRTSLSHGTSVVACYTLVLLFIAGFFVFSGQRLSNQYGELEQRIPQALQTVEQRLSGIPVLGTVGQQIGDLRSRLMEDGNRTPQETEEEQENSEEQTMRVARLTLAALSMVGLVMLLSFYIAYDGKRYTRGILRLVPPDHRHVGEDLATSLSRALPLWLVGRLASMLVVALLTAPGLYFLGIPLAFVLAMIAGLFSFVPVLGPLASVVPAALITLESAPDKILWVLALYGAVQILESWAITPMIQDDLSSTPPLLLLSAQLVAGVLVGVAGVMFSTPLALAAMVTVQVLYLRHGLDEEPDMPRGL